jgi:eukaryotic-like serine/threonine-protein kinase
MLDALRRAARTSAPDTDTVPERLLAKARSLAAPAPHPPERLGKFELLEEIGRGSFGTVYRARDTELERVVAIKVLRAGSLASSDEVERFLREARSAAQLKHPGIVLVYGTNRTTTGIHYIVEELIDGGTLADRLRGAPFDFRRAAELIESVAAALEYAHGQGVIHRDLKPSNIVLDADEKPHLTDFGLAKRTGEEPPATPCGIVLGTPAYMSPEQAEGHAGLVDARSDIYALGVVLYEVLTGRRPFEGSHDKQLIEAIACGAVPPSRIRPSIPRDLEKICLEAMARDPAKRYPSAGEMAADLRRFLEGEPIKARTPGPFERLTRWTRRNPWAAGLLAAVTLGSAGALRHISSVSGDLIRRSALDGAAMQAEMLEVVNDHYTSNVVGRLPFEVATHDYASKPGTVPLPATFLTELGERISAGETGMQVRHYSDYPFEARRNREPIDGFGREAIHSFRQRKERGEPLEPHILFTEEELDGTVALRYAVPRIMKKDCVDCHNDDPESPKRDWKEGDVGGVLEIIRPLPGDRALPLHSTLVLAGFLSVLLLGLSVAGIWMASRRRARAAPVTRWR